MSDDFDPARYRWSWLVLVVFFFAALFVALWTFTAAARVKQHHPHGSAPVPAVISTNKN